jgi:peptidoglycan/xylan/chitin deacetylase (PgdA/CDA1 family)
LSEHTVELLLAHGFLYDSSLMGADYWPYRARRGDRAELGKPFRFGEETALIEMPISWTLDDHPHFEFMRTQQTVAPGLMATGGVLQNWLDDFRYMRATMEWGVITYTCHPYVIGRGHRMLMLERLIEALLGQGAVFATMADAADEFVTRAGA